MKRCLQCRTRYETGPACPYCKSTAFIKEGAVEALQAVARGGEIEAPGSKGNAPGARESVMWGVAGLIGFFGLGFFGGPMAIIQARKAMAIIASDPRYGGTSMARNGLILGWFSLGVNALALASIVLRALR